MPAFVGYAILTASVMWPAVRHFRTRAMVDGVDAAMFTWAWWAMPRALAEGQNPYRTDLIFYPVGADLELTTTAPLVSFLTWPVQAVLGSTAQVNLVQLVSMFLAGLATYFLAYRLCHHRGAAFVAGVAYALLPGRFAHVDSHLNLVETAVLPFGLLLFLRFLEGPTLRRAAALGAACGATFLIEPQLAILLGFGLVILGLRHRRAIAQQGRRLAGAAVVALVVAAPLLVPLAAAMVSGNVGEADPTSASIVYSASPLSWVVPPLDRLWLGNLVSLEPLTPTIEGIAYPGLVMLALAIGGAALIDRDRRRGWVAIAVAAFVLSLGPHPFVRDTLIDVPLPFYLLRLVPGLDAMRVPGRFALLGALALYALAAMALTELDRRVRRPWLLPLIGLITLVELLPGSLPSRPHEIPDPYAAIAADTAGGAVLEIPLKWSTTQGHYGFRGHDENFMFLLYAMEHERSIVSGAVSRYPDDDLERLLRIPAYRQLLSLGGEPGFEEPARFDRDDLADLGIGYIVYHRDDPAPRVLEHLETLDLPVLADDGTVIVWKVPK